jgi:hypothetical protein
MQTSRYLSLYDYMDTILGDDIDFAGFLDMAVVGTIYREGVTDTAITLSGCVLRTVRGHVWGGRTSTWQWIAYQHALPMKIALLRQIGGPVNTEINRLGLPQQKIFRIKEIFEGIDALRHFDFNQEHAVGIWL